MLAESSSFGRVMVNSKPKGRVNEQKGKGTSDAMSRQTDAAPTTPKLIYLTKIELPN